MTINWGILGTANIAVTSFLPGLRAAGDGVALAVAGRTRSRVEAFARENEIEHAIEGYDRLLQDERIDSVYIPLPNTLHAAWTIAALRAGKAVLCEKPLCVSAEETETVLSIARESEKPLWEAFVFEFREQTRRVEELLAEGAIGELYEIHGNFHFQLGSDRHNIRLDPALGGGAVYDVGCYPIRLAGFLFDDMPQQAAALASWAPEGVDEETQGVLGFPGDRRLVFSCGIAHISDTSGRLLGTHGEIRLTHPYHPGPTDTLELIRHGRDAITEKPTGPEPSFTPAIQHIHAALRGEEKPRHLAVDEAMSNAVAIDMILASARANTQDGG